MDAGVVLFAFVLFVSKPGASLMLVAPLRTLNNGEGHSGPPACSVGVATSVRNQYMSPSPGRRLEGSSN